ncbi:UrcA family protein [Novosphingobium kunmingense]|uniref:UrcA family protein n=1 Tax=Novosphingobium kunmingense TaxID=1211806 RepID=A0A2N0HKE9_9SPHN|nr:UrcA family protein [Novosphingobium kunmingense]PKB19424.1 UrcA family protein [Novosphingobium kunmingense]
MIKFYTVRAAAIAVAATIATTAALPASAETFDADGRYQVTVNVDDGMLATPRGVNRLRQTLLRNARRTCRADVPSAAGAANYRVCMAEMTELGHRAINARAEQWAARHNQSAPLALVEKKD